jgi:hypothetical protein
LPGVNAAAGLLLGTFHTPVWTSAINGRPISSLRYWSFFCSAILVALLFASGNVPSSLVQAWRSGALPDRASGLVPAIPGLRQFANKFVDFNPMRS